MTEWFNMFTGHIVPDGGLGHDNLFLEDPYVPERKQKSKSSWNGKKNGANKMRKPFLDYDLNKDNLIATVETKRSKNLYLRNRRGITYIAKMPENGPCLIQRCNEPLTLDFWLYCGYACLLTVHSESLMRALSRAKNSGKFNWDVREVKFTYRGDMHRAGYV